MSQTRAVIYDGRQWEGRWSIVWPGGLQETAEQIRSRLLSEGMLDEFYSRRDEVYEVRTSDIPSWDRVPSWRMNEAFFLAVLEFPPTGVSKVRSHRFERVTKKGGRKEKERGRGRRASSVGPSWEGEGEELSEEEFAELAESAGGESTLLGDLDWAYKNLGKRRPEVESAPSSTALALWRWGREHRKDFMGMVSKHLGAERPESEEQRRVEEDTRRLKGMFQEFSEELKCPNCGSLLVEM